MNEQQKQNSKNDKQPSDATEAGYLTNQANEAATALGQAFAALKQDLVRGVDPTTLARQYPWAAVGAAAVAGFMAASTVVPSKEQQALKKLERIEQALRPYPMGAEYAVPPAAASGAPGHQGKSIMGRIASELFSALKPALSSALAAYAAAPSDEDDGKKNGNGHTASAAAAGNAVYYQQEEDQDRPQPA